MIDLYVITAMSNMHVGSGENNVGIIDNLVQRDFITDLPNINSSSLKGALREFFDHHANVTTNFVSDVFGTSPKERDNKLMKQGRFKFFEASLLSLPVRSNKAAYLRATSPEVIKDLLYRVKEFGININNIEMAEALRELSNLEPQPSNPITLSIDGENAIIEDVDLKAHYLAIKTNALNVINQLIGDNVVLLHHDDFSRLCNKTHLPVIARNYLESGESKNLWYEEVVPRFSQFYFVLIKDDEYGEAFDNAISSSLVQIGGNASIGYGFSKIRNMTNSNTGG